MAFLSLTIFFGVVEFMPLILGLFFIIAAIFVEIAGFIVVGNFIGILPTLGLVIAAMGAGIVLLRAQGKGIIQRIRQDLERGQVPDRPLLEGMMLVLASILLIIPGFVGDIIGLLLFLPPIRALLWQIMAKYVVSTIKFTQYPSKGGSAKRTGNADSGTIIDLDEDEYQTHGNEDSPWRRLDDKKNRQ